MKELALHGDLRCCASNSHPNIRRFCGRTVLGVKGRHTTETEIGIFCVVCHVHEGIFEYTLIIGKRRPVIETSVPVLQGSAKVTRASSLKGTDDRKDRRDLIFETLVLIVDHA